MGTTRPRRDRSGIPPLKILFIKDRNLRQDATDFMVLTRSDVAVECQIVVLSLDRQILVELPYHISSFFY